MPIILDTDLITVVDMTKVHNIATHKIDKFMLHLQDSDRVLKRDSQIKIYEREYFGARSRARHPVCTAMIDHIITRIPDDTYSLLSELERELVRYIGL
jgi:hypothetical protein